MNKKFNLKDVFYQFHYASDPVVNEYRVDPPKSKYKEYTPAMASLLLNNNAIPILLDDIVE